MVNGLSGQPIHWGAGVGGVSLPDFGVSERLSNFFGQGRTTQGGSNLYGNQQQTTLVPAGINNAGITNFAPSGQSGAYGNSYTNRSSGNVLGDNIQPPPPSKVGGNESGFNVGTPVVNTQQQQGPNFADQASHVYDQYLSSLDQQLGGLDAQRASQEQVANNTYQQGLNTVNSQYAGSQAELDANRQKTLRDLSQNLANSFRAGNQYLGTRGASDSSAANQYSFALAKLGSQQRGDVQSQYDQNLFKLKNTYDTETKNLELEKNNQLQQISQWFAEAQNALRGQKGQVAAQQSQQALSIAMQMAQQVQQQVAQRRAALDTWAANHATSFSQLAQQLGQTGNFNVNAANNLGINQAQQQVPTGVVSGYGQSNDRDMFGNPIYR